MKIEISLNSMQSLSAVPLSLARRYMKHFNRGRYANIFNKYGEGKGKDRYRIYIPVNATHMISPKTMTIPKEIEDHLTSLKMKIDNYAVGTVHLPDGKRIVRLGKVLAKQPDLKKIYDNDPQRKATKMVSSWVVISCHPYDIIGMSFDRGWTSCMNISEDEDEEGSNKEFVEHDVKEGTLVAYLIKETDRNINAPTARIAIKPYRNEGHTILRPGTVYGTAPSSFADIVQRFCEFANSGSPSGKYVLPESLYDDGTGQEMDHYTEQDMQSKNNPFLKMTVNQLVYRARLLDSLVALKFLANHENEEVRTAVARNRMCNSEMLTKFAEDTDREVKLAVAIHPQTPVPVLIQLAGSDDDRVKRGAIRNANFVDSAWKFIKENHKNRETVMIFCESCAIEPKQADELLELCPKEWRDDMFNAFFKNRTRLTIETRAHLILNYPEHEEFWAHNAGVTQFTHEVYKRFASATSETVLEHLAANRELPVDIQVQLITSDSAAARLGMVRNTQVSGEALTALVNSINYQTKASVGLLMFAMQRNTWTDEHLKVVLPHPESHHFIISHALPEFAVDYIFKNTKNDDLRDEAEAILIDFSLNKKRAT